MLALIARQGLFAKFLLVLVPTFLSLSAVGFIVLLRYDEQATGEMLAARIGNQSARIASMLARPSEAASEADRASNRGLLSLLAADRAVTCAALRERIDGKHLLVAPSPQACKPRPQTHQFSIPVGDEETILAVTFSAAEVISATKAQRGTMFIVIVLMLVVATISAAIGFRFIVTARLERLRNGIRLITETGERLPVEPGGNDALGDILQAFNEMIAREEERENTLLHTNEAFLASQDELKSEKRFRHFASSASDWYWEMDSELRFSHFSERFTEITGVPQEALLGKTRQETGIPDVDVAEWERYLDDLANHRPFRNFTHPRVMESGKTVWVSISGRPFFDDDGEFLGYRGVGADITDRVEIEKQLAAANEMKEVSEAAAQAKSEFLATMSHEIRTPINGVLGTSDLLLRETLSPDHRYLVETIDQSGRALLDLVNDILDFSKIEAGRIDLECAQFDLHQLVEEVVESAAFAAHGKGLELACLVTPGVPTWVRGDAARLRQVLANLVGNAVKFTETGHIVVDVSPPAREAPTKVRFEVRDTGIGIAAQNHAKIFSSFSQADRSTTRRFGGTGLGLAISSKLVGLMGGEIELESDLGSGSRFRFAIDLSEEPSAQAVSRKPFQGLRALLVCEEIVGRSLCLQLGNLGVVSTHTTSGRRAHEHLFDAQSTTSQRFDLLIIGDRLDEMSGLDLARSFAAHPCGSTAVPRWVVLSRVGEDESIIEACRSVGLSARLIKPVRRSALYNCLLNVTGQAPAQPVSDSEQSMDLAPIGASVLLAEDHPVNQAVLVRMLKVIGCEATVARDGQLALDELESKAFDVVLMDCDMPRMDGFEATAVLRQREAQSGAKRTPVIALTANALLGDRERCLDAGMDDYLSKPVDTQRLHEMIAQWVPETTSEGSPSNEVLADVDKLTVAAAAPALDSAIIANLHLMDPDGEDGFFAELVARYTSNCRRDLATLRAALAATELEEIRKTAHRLKSASASLGARIVAELWSRMEAAAGQGDIETALAMVDDLEREQSRALDALETVVLNSALTRRDVA